MVLESSFKFLDFWVSWGMERLLEQTIEPKFGRMTYIMIYAVLEWILIIILLIDGLIAFGANEYARLFGLQFPCLLCTRIDHYLVHRNHDFYYNDSICDAHKKDVASLAYCHNHQRLSYASQMCEDCLLSFAIDNKSNLEIVKSLIGVLGAGLDCSTDGVLKICLKSQAEDEINQQNDDKKCCSCCGESLKDGNSSLFNAVDQQSQASNGGYGIEKTPNWESMLQIRPPSPGEIAVKNNDSLLGFNPLHCTEYDELKFMSDTESETLEEEDGSGAAWVPDKEENGNTITEQLPIECKDPNEDSCQSPEILCSGLPETSLTGPPVAHIESVEKPESRTMKDSEGTSGSEEDIKVILDRLKRRVRMNRKSLIILYKELDEERNAAAVAANQAMIMITRLQTEKAAVQMEALQYRRMMDEQIEYNQEALHFLKDLLTKREEEIKVLVSELERHKKGVGCEEGTVDMEGSQDWTHVQSRRLKSGPSSSTSERSDFAGLPTNLSEEPKTNGDDIDQFSYQTKPSLMDNETKK